MEEIKIVTFTGKSGCGKTTTAGLLLERSQNLHIITNTTTRGPRPSDLNGEYRYITTDIFCQEFEKGEYIWTAPIGLHGNNYATQRCNIDQALMKPLGHYSLICLTPDVLKTLHDYAPGRILSLILESPEEETRDNLIARGDDPEQIDRRIQDCITWSESIPEIPLIHRVPYDTISNRLESVLDILEQYSICCQ